MLEQSPVNQTRHSGTSTANVRLEYTIVKLSHPLAGNGNGKGNVQQ